MNKIVDKFFWVDSSLPNFQLKCCIFKTKKDQRAAVSSELDARCKYNRKRCELLMKKLFFIYGDGSSKSTRAFHPVMEGIILYLWSDEFLKLCMLEAEAAQLDTVARYILRYAFTLVCSLFRFS